MGTKSVSVPHFVMLLFHSMMFQIGCRFWDLALREHAAYSKQRIFDDAMSSFFRNMDSAHEEASEISVGKKIRALKARVSISFYSK